MTTYNGIIRKVGDLGVRTDIPGHPGSNIHPLLSVEDTGSFGLLVALNRIEPGGSVEPHYHEDCLTFTHTQYVISGDLIATAAGNEVRVGPGSVIYSHSDEVHGLKNVGSDIAEILQVSASPEGDVLGKMVFPK
ncbi:cupin domain-containing protein [Chloroflexota bacterium]